MTPRVASIVVAAQLAVTLAHADAVEDAALAHLDRGVAAYRAGDFVRAHTELAEANRLAPDRPNPYRWLALTEAQLDDCRGALVNIEGFLSRVPATDPRVAELVQLRDRCLHTGKLDVSSTPSGATIRVDGGPPIATTPARNLVLPTGPHVLSLEKPGFAALSHPIDVRPFGIDRATFTLSTAPARSTPLVRRWWFWTAVGALAITAAGVTYELTRDSASRLPALTCDGSGCHP